jgi:putative ABC transport system substrate-binding protein
MRRREFITLIGGAAAAWPAAAHAQQTVMPVVGYLTSTPAGDGAGNLAAFRAGLSGAGFIERRNARIEYRWADNQNDRLPALAADLVHRRVDAIMGGGNPAIVAAKSVMTDIPIVFYTGADPVQFGFVESLSRPGRNLTGVSGRHCI